VAVKKSKRLSDQSQIQAGARTPDLSFCHRLAFF